MTTTEVFIDIYIAVKYEITKSYYGRPTIGSPSYAKFERIVDVINQYHIDPFHFLAFMLRFYAPARIFPQPTHLIADKAFAKYRYHQALKGIYRYKNFSIDGDVVYIHETNEIVSLSKDIQSSIEQDIKLRYVFYVADIISKDCKPTLINQELWPALQYAKVKFEYLGKPYPQIFQELERRLLQSTETAGSV